MSQFFWVTIFECFVFRVVFGSLKLGHAPRSSKEHAFHEWGA
jgi:hypothetical protein